MRIPSIKSTLEAVRDSFLRFPFAVSGAFICMVLGVLYVQDVFPGSVAEQLSKVILFLILAFPAWLSAVLFSEAKGYKASVRYLLQVIVTALVALYYFVSPRNPDDFLEKDTFFFALLLVAAILSCFFAAFPVRENQEGFWEFSRRSMARLFTAGLYCVCLFGGIALAFVAIEELFAVLIRTVHFQTLFFLILFACCWFFVAGIPQKAHEIKAIERYPKALRFFAQYVIVPIIGIYLLILYAYSIKILVTCTLPQGWVSYLVLALAMVGIIAFLLIWPLRNEAELWTKSYSKYFFISLLPLVVLLWVAIGRRVSDYGITPNRYLILVVSLWLTWLIFYFLLSHRQNIKLIPVTLACILVLISFGPWGITGLSLRSQAARLDHIFEQSGLAPSSSEKKLPSEVQTEIKGILIDMIELDGGQFLAKQWGVTLADSLRQWQRTDTLVKYLHLDAISGDYSRQPVTFHYNHYHSTNALLPISGFDLLKDQNGTYLDGKTWTSETVETPKRKYWFSYEQESPLLFLHTDTDTSTVSIRALYEEMDKRGLFNTAYSEQAADTVDTYLPTLTFQTDKYKIQLLINSFEGTYYGDTETFNVSRLSYLMLIKEE